jgi:DTW domain-containing protein
VCPEVPTVPTRTELLVIRHQREGWKSTGTARIAALALPRLRCVEYGDDGLPARDELDGMSLENTALLFPAEPTVEWKPVDRLILLDGTWRQARRMFHRLTRLHGLPRLALPPKPEAVLRLRASSFDEGRSTLEAVADALSLLEGEEAASPLHHLHRLYVERVLRARGTWTETSVTD